MPKIIKVGIFLLLVVSQRGFAQNYGNSLYSRYNVGDLINTGFAYNRSMGGSSIALRPHNQINYLNPASYTSQDTNSFLFQVGFTGRDTRIHSDIDQDKSINFNIEYLIIGFPVTKWWNMSLGATPFSRVQYNVLETSDSSLLGEKMSTDYSGFGGYNEFYWGNALEFSKIFSVGANVSYIFGSIDKKQSNYLTNLQGYSAVIEQQQNYIASDFYVKLGAQLHPVIADKHKFIFGVTYDINTNIDLKLKSKADHINSYGLDPAYWTIDTINYKLDTISPFNLPAKLGIGLSYTYNDKITLTGEYSRQDWSGTNIANSDFKMGLYESFRTGIEIIPSPSDNKTRISYFQRVHYRAGFYHTKTYLYFKNNNISSTGFSAGLGLPIKYARKSYTGTTLNIGYQYGIRGTTDNGLIKEKAHIITFGLTLHDFWFLKPKYD